MIELTADEARGLGARVVKECNDARVKFGKTNGKICLHIHSNRQSRTIFSAAEWERCPFREFRKKKSHAQNEIAADISNAIRNVEAQ